jgi:hypothetical protein
MLTHPISGFVHGSVTVAQFKIVFAVRRFVKDVQNSAGSDIDVISLLSASSHINVVANLALETYVRDKAMTGLRINSWLIVCVWIAVGIPVNDIEQ